MIDAIGPSVPLIQALEDSGKPTERLRRSQEVSGQQDPERLEKIAKDFEGLLIHQILKQMKETIAEMEPEDEADSSSEQIKSMYWSFWADAVTEQGGFGFWKQIYQQLERSSQSGPPDSGIQVDTML